MTIRLAVAGVGNCTSVFLQGLRYYSGSDSSGLWHPTVAGMKPRDVEVVAAFDIDSRKVGADLSRAAFEHPNVASKYVDLPRLGVSVKPGLAKGEPPPHLRTVELRSRDEEAVVKELKQSGADILVNLISSGSDAASEGYAAAALRAGCAFVNCTPSLLLRGKLASAYAKSGLPLVGDDMMSQFGGTAFHKGLLELMVKRGVKVSKSYQLDVGGGTETLNTIDETIRAAKREVKTSALTSEVPYKFETIAGTTDFVDYMGNDRTSYFWFQGSGFMNSGISVDIYLRSSDGTNAGNILLDVVRATHACKESGERSKTEIVCAYGFKSSSKHSHLDEAYSRFVSAFVT